MAGFLLASLPVLTLGLGGIEAAHWAGLRQTLSLALMEATRAGATRQARPQAIARAFEHGLRMVYPDPLATARALRERRTTLGTPWRIRVARPLPEAFLDHADPDLRGPRDHPGQALIRNDYQARQQALRLAQGWPAGRGPRSGLTIHEANTLVLELWWPHRPLLPGMAAIARALAPLAGDPAQSRLMAAGYLPFRRRAAVAMQSHPAAWPDMADGRVTHGTAPPPAWNTSQPGPGGTPDMSGRPSPGAGGTVEWAAPPEAPDTAEDPGTATEADWESGATADTGTEAGSCEPAP